MSDPSTTPTGEVTDVREALPEAPVALVAPTDLWGERMVAGLDRMNEQHNALLKLLSEQHEKVMSSHTAGAPKLMARIGESVDQLEATIKKTDAKLPSQVLEYNVLNPYNYVRK